MRFSKSSGKHLLVSIFTTKMFLHASKKWTKYKKSKKLHIYGFEGHYAIIKEVYNQH